MPILLDVLTGGGLVAFLVAVLVICVVVYVLKLLIDYLGLPVPIRNIVFIIIAVVAILYLLNRFAGVSL